MFTKTILGFFAMLQTQVAPLPQAAGDAAKQPPAASAPAKPAAPTAAQVVAGVQAYYKATVKLESTFRQRYTNSVIGKTSVSDGKLYLSKPGKMRWDYQKPDKKMYVSDGTMLWVIEDANKQAFKQKIEDELLPVAVTFLYGKGELDKDFNASLDPGKHGGKNDIVVKLVPKQPTAQYKHLWLVVDPKDYHVKESIIEEVSGNLNAFAFGNIRLNDLAKNVADKVFVVSEAALKKKGFKVIEPSAAKAPEKTPGPAAPKPEK